MEDLNVLIAKHKDKAVMGVIFVISLIAAKTIYDIQMKKYAKVKEEIRIEQDKSTTLDRIMVLNENVKKLKQKSWDTTDFNTIVERISDLALECNVKIYDIAPGGKEDVKQYVVIPFSINAEATFNNYYKLMKKIESYPMLLRIKSASVMPMDTEIKVGKEEAGVLRLNIFAEAFYLK